MHTLVVDSKNTPKIFRDSYLEDPNQTQKKTPNVKSYGGVGWMIINNSSEFSTGRLRPVICQCYWWTTPLVDGTLHLSRGHDNSNWSTWGHFGSLWGSLWGWWYTWGQLIVFAAHFSRGQLCNHPISRNIGGAIRNTWHGSRARRTPRLRTLGKLHQAFDWAGFGGLVWLLWWTKEQSGDSPVDGR